MMLVHREPAPLAPRPGSWLLFEVSAGTGSRLCTLICMTGYWDRSHSHPECLLGQTGQWTSHTWHAALTGPYSVTKSSYPCVILCLFLQGVLLES